MNNASLFYREDFLTQRTQQAAASLDIKSFDWYQEMLVSRPVYYDTERACWMIFRYADVQKVVMDTQTFSSQRSPNSNGQIDPVMSGGILGMDPPHHRHLRTLISQAFTPRSIASLEPRIASITKTLLDRVAEQETMDIVNDLAFPLPITVIADLLGVPQTDQTIFRQWSNDFVGADYAKRQEVSKHIGAYFKNLIVERRKQPRADLISDLLVAEVNGERLPEEDILGTGLLLLVAGHETTTSIIGNAVVCLDEYPEARQQLLAEPALWPTAIEELIRYRAPVHTMVRVATQDTILGDQHIKAGDLVTPIFAAANFDPDQFPNPNLFDIKRTPNRHLSFGYGIHFCLGAPLARLETRIALGALLERFPHLKRDRTHPLELKPSSVIYGYKHVPVFLK